MYYFIVKYISCIEFVVSTRTIIVQWMGEGKRYMYIGIYVYMYVGTAVTEKLSDQLFVTLQTPSIFPIVHKQLIRTLFKGQAVFFISQHRKVIDFCL